MVLSQVKLDENGFIRDDAGRRLCRVLPGGVLEFPDRDERRRGSVGPPRVGLAELVAVAKGQTGVRSQ